MKWLAANIVVDGQTFSGSKMKVNSQADQDRYENDVLSIGTKIRQAPFGRQLLDLIDHTQPIVIKSSTDPVNAVAHPLNPADLANEFAKGYLIPGSGIHNTRGGLTVSGRTGTGLGCVAEVLFNPHGTFWGIAADAILLHELLHAYRMASGRWSPVAVSSFVKASSSTTSAIEDWLFEDWEEWFSVVAEGIYASESGAASVRIAHNLHFWFSAIKPAGSPKNFFHPNAMTASEIFADKYGQAINRIMKLEPAIYRAMSYSNAWFNPVKDYEEQVLGTRK